VTKKLVLSSLITAAMACAQYAPAPQAYTLIQNNSLFGPPATNTYYRNGSKAVIDIVHPAANPGDKPTHQRSILDLQAHTSIGWDLTDPAAECGTGAFSGDWGDPFVGAAGFMDEIDKMHPTPAGAETVNGIATKVSEFVMEGATAKSKVWLDPKYGLIMRLVMAEPNAPPKVAIEVTQLTLAAPPASLFAPACKAPPDPVETENAKIVALTGGPASDYAFANKGTASIGGCLVFFHVVRAGSMTPVPDGFTVWVDGKEVAVRGGRALLAGTPKEFNIDVRVPSGGATGPIIRQCNKPQTTLLMVAKNFPNLGEGAEFLWVKSGKFAGQ
jgi:hypothetical protein